MTTTHENAAFPTQTTALHRAAEEAGHAPSILNTQPWRWHIHDDALDLYADTTRQLGATDPQGRLLTLSCGAALHHARVTLAANGFEPVTDRLPDPDHPALLARIRAGRPQPAGPDDASAYRAIRRRHSDRRRFSSTRAVNAGELAVLRAAAEAEHARLYRMTPDDIEFLAHATQRARVIGAKDERRVVEQYAWTHREPGSADGVPGDTVPAAAARPVPVRDFDLGGEATLDPGSEDDRNTEYLIIVTDHDRRADWLAAGEATSAVWLAATAQGLAASPMSSAVEIPGARALLAGLVDPAGHPQLVLRAGIGPEPAPLPPSPRRPSRDVIDTGEPPGR
ncbi:nitroreductase [Dactylosporangium sp. NPDC005555]|uniref:Acg family FMN-binding oxidoreductase n=1 Tax=Dactylosporangium sp. NPDC005555 TaxID=3154889 RepID=UPI0033AC69A6